MTVRIVVGVDFTELGELALDEAVRYVSRMEDVELHPAFCLVQADGRQVDKLSDTLDTLYARLREVTVRRCEVVEHDWEQNVVFHVRVGDPVEALSQVAVDVDADMIVVGTNARKGLTKVLLGSVAEELVRTAPVPVMVARRRDRSRRKSDRPEAPRPGVPLKDRRIMADEHLVFGRRPSHISNLA